MNNLTKTTFKERFKDASIFAGLSSGIIGITQALVKNDVEEIILSSSADFFQSLFTTTTNLSVYNYLKNKIFSKYDIDEKYIIGVSNLIVSTFGTGGLKYITHRLANSSNPEEIAMFYAVCNVVIYYLYEKKILKKRQEINKVEDKN